jgi:hypothetical protein
MPTIPEREPKTFSEKYIPRIVNWVCKLLGWRMLLLSIVKTKGHPDDPNVELKEMRTIRSAGTQRYPSHPITQALFASLMELQMNHLRELQNEQRAQREAAAPKPKANGPIPETVN